MLWEPRFRASGEFHIPRSTEQLPYALQPGSAAQCAEMGACSICHSGFS